SLDVVCFAMLVPSLMIATLALTMTPPAESFNVPRIVPKVDCPFAVAVTSASVHTPKPAPRKPERLASFIIPPSSSSLRNCVLYRGLAEITSELRCCQGAKTACQRSLSPAGHAPAPGSQCLATTTSCG